MKKIFFSFFFFLIYIALGLAADIWTCSMHPQVKQETKGLCPICHMALVKLGPSTSSSKINFDNRQQSLLGIKLGKVIKKEFFKPIDVAGRVAFDPELFTAQNEYVESLKQRESVKNSPVADIKHSAQAMVDSSRTRLKVLGLSDVQIQKISSSSNLMSSLLPQKGEKLWIYAEVYEMDLSYIRPQMKALITSANFRGRKISGEVIAVDRVINTQTRTAKVRIVLNADDVIRLGVDLRPESFVEVSLLSPLGQQLVVEREAILDTGKNTYAFVVNNINHNDPKKGIEIDQRMVIVGPSGGENSDEIAILEGLKEDDTIVTSANFLIDSETKLKVNKVQDSGEANAHNH